MPPDPFDRADDSLPLDPARRKARRLLGCCFLLMIAGLLIWFGVTHTEMGRDRNFLGMTTVMAPVR